MFDFIIQRNEVRKLAFRALSHCQSNSDKKRDLKRHLLYTGYYQRLIALKIVCAPVLRGINFSGNIIVLKIVTANRRV